MLKPSISMRLCGCFRYQIRGYSVKTNLKTFSQKKQHYGGQFPDKLLTKKLKTPDVLYMAQKDAAEAIDKHLDPFFRQSPCTTILEMNPGTGMFTHKLLDREEKFKKILLLEGMEFFMNNLQELHSLYPERVKVKHADLTYIWKIMYQDRMDNGSRVANLLRDVPQQAHTDEANMIVYGNVGSLQFFKHLINSIVFQNSLLSLGRSEMYFVVPPSLYLQLSCSPNIGFMFYRSTSILFQILFEHKFIARLERKDFLPSQTEYKATKGSKLGKVLTVDPLSMYLVRIIPRRNIFDFVSTEDLPALWYFIKQNCISRRNRIIPSLEKWIPGCGPRLIINNQPSTVPKPVYGDENLNELPQYSSQCLTISDNDLYGNINIYTQFGDLTPGQFLTLFCQFRKWPEYKESSFLASFESSMIKMAASAEDSVEGIADEDDEASAEIENVQQTDYVKPIGIKKKNRKVKRSNISE